MSDMFNLKAILFSMRKRFTGKSKTDLTILSLHQVIQHQNQIIQQLQSENQDLRCLANLDELTRLANRRKFYSYLYETWEKSNQEPFSVIIADVDFFKAYNDTYGHLAGDVTLKQIAEAIQKGVQEVLEPDSFLVARYGGEEFAVIIPGLNTQQSLAIADKVRQQVFDLNIPHEESKTAPFVTMSLGVATRKPDDNFSPLELLMNADRALYKAKSKGRNRVAYSSHLHSSESHTFCSCCEQQA
ncbi:GGDEF domain-containing protein [Capilliphycus salinus ALCB114379]|uniref:GGDEF domain-containing protein n=1 Tax=Capilliphycus salinus TaxID=2768948 RepID=UPI0039A562AC